MASGVATFSRSWLATASRGYHVTCITSLPDHPAIDHNDSAHVDSAQSDPLLPHVPPPMCVFLYATARYSVQQDVNTTEDLRASPRETRTERARQLSTRHAVLTRIPRSRMPLLTSEGNWWPPQPSGAAEFSLVAQTALV